MKPRTENPADDASATGPTPPSETTTAAETATSQSGPEGKVYLTTRPSKAFGGRGRFVTPSEVERAAAPDGLLVEPTPEQLAQRA